MMAQHAPPRPAGRNLARQAFVDATWTLRTFDLVGFEIHAMAPERSASRFVEWTLVGQAGNFIRRGAVGPLGAQTARAAVQKPPTRV